MGSCGPVNNGGNYIMFPHASTGNQPNNDDFSDCSRTMMAGIIRAKGGCFSSMCVCACVFVNMTTTVL